MMRKRKALLSNLAIAAIAAGALTSMAGVAVAQTAANPLLPHNLSPWGMFMNADIVVKR